MARSLRSPDATSTAGVVALVAILLALFFPYFEGTRNANERPRLLQGIARVEQGVWFLDGPAGTLDPGPDTARSADGHLYPNKPPGTSVVAAVAYRLARATTGDEPLTLRRYTLWARLLGGWLPTVVLCGFLVRRWSTGAGAQIAAVLLYALGTPAASYAHLLYGHQLAAALLTIGSLLLLDAIAPDAEAPPRTPTGRRWRAALGGFLAGGAVAVEYGAVFAALPLAVVLVAGVARQRARARTGSAATLAVGIALALVPVAALMRYHQVAFGSVWSTGYHHATDASFAAKHAEGLLGLSGPSMHAAWVHLVSPGGGLLWWAPLVPLSIYGLVHLAKSGPHRTEARLHLGLLAVYAAITCSLNFEGGWRVGPRYLVLVLPSLVLGWSWALGLVRERPIAIAAVCALGTYSLVVNQLAADLWPHLDLTNVHHPVAEVLLPLLDAGARPYGLLDEAFSLDALWIALGVSVAIWLATLARLWEPGWRAGAAIVLGCGLGIFAVGQTRRFAPHPKAERNLAYILRQWEPPRTGAGEAPSAILTQQRVETRGGSRAR